MPRSRASCSCGPKARPPQRGCSRHGSWACCRNWPAAPRAAHRTRWHWRFRRGVPEIQVATSLQGLGLALPAPLAKTAEAVLPVRFEIQVARESLAAVPAGTAVPPLRDQITLDLARSDRPVTSASTRASRRVVRGAIGIGLTGGETAPMPADGVAANIRAAQVDVDAWEKVLNQTTGANSATRTDSATASAAEIENALLS